MGVAETKFGYFVIWSPLESFSLRVDYDHDHYVKITSSLDVFFKNYVAPVLAEEEPLCYCGSCGQVCLTEEEIEDNKDRSVSCDGCSVWYHFGCADVPQNIDDVVQEWYCQSCISAMISDIRI